MQIFSNDTPARSITVQDLKDFNPHAWATQAKIG